MAKASVVQRNIKRQGIVEKFAQKRLALKEKISNPNIDFYERFQSKVELDSMCKDGSRVRLRNRCAFTGRGRGVYRKFKLSRITLRELASKGVLPGVRKASW